MSRHFTKGARANPPENGPTGGRHGPSAMPESPDAIRVRVDDDEPPALVFNDQAQPGALVSWAWCQLTALDALLRAMLERRSSGEDDPDLVGAVRTVIVPVIKALEFSEQRAHELQREREAAAAAPADKSKGGARKKKREPAD